MIFWADHALFDHLFQCKRAYLGGRAASQGIYAGMVLFADFESTYAQMFFHFFKKSFVGLTDSI